MFVCILLALPFGVIGGQLSHANAEQSGDR
jgi:hypothetical protein